MSSLLNWILWTPIIGMIVVLIGGGKGRDNFSRWATLITTFTTFVLTLVLCVYENIYISILDYWI